MFVECFVQFCFSLPALSLTLYLHRGFWLTFISVSSRRWLKICNCFQLSLINFKWALLLRVGLSLVLLWNYFASHSVMPIILFICVRALIDVLCIEMELKCRKTIKTTTNKSLPFDCWILCMQTLFSTERTSIIKTVK